MKPISRQYSYEADFFAPCLDLEGLIFPQPDVALPVFVKTDFFSEQEAELLEQALKRAATISSDASSDAGSDASETGSDSLSQYVSGSGRMIEVEQQASKLCDDLIVKAKSGLEHFFRLPISGIGDAKGMILSEGAGCGVHADNGVREYDEDGWISRWKITAPFGLTFIFCLTDSVDEVVGENLCVGANIEFPYLFDNDYASFLLEPRRGMLIAFPANPVFSYQIHEVYEGESRFVLAWQSLST